jgi:threonine aldolase
VNRDELRTSLVADLRSDTVTRPTSEMRAAMAAAEVGDDVMGEDPTVNALEAKFARLVGKEAAVFVPSGTMANLVSLLAHCRRGDEVILGDKSHTYLMEQGGSAAVGGLHPRPLPNLPDGTLDLEEVARAVRPDDPHHPVSRLICLENSHNYCSGAPLDGAYMESVRRVADAHGLAVHVDGARLFNTSTALGCPPTDLTRHADTVSACLSKGLAAPAGSLVAGPRGFVAGARRARKLLGGGMRQAGVLAAAGIVALDTMIGRLAEDHGRARRLAEGLAELPGIVLDPARIRTNIVVFEVDHPRVSAQAFETALEARGVLLRARDGRRVRAVTHYEVADEAVERTIAIAADVLHGH